MLEINVPVAHLFDEEANVFFDAPGATLLLEHSLFSLSKWESKWNKPFLDGAERTSEETKSYIAMMNLAPEPHDRIFKQLSKENHDEIAKYIDSKQTATWFREDPNLRPSTDVITAEIIYYWMVAHNIPFECQYWHLNRLLTLIRVCNEKNKPATKSKVGGSRDFAASRRAINARRKAELGTSG